MYNEQSENEEGMGHHGMWMHMPKDVKVAKLEMKKRMMEAKLEFIGKMLEMAKQKPDENK